MDKLDIYFLDINNIDLDALLASKYIYPSDINIFDKYTNTDVKKEKIASTYLKNKYIGNYYIDNNGKPLSDHCYFNISHSKGYVVLIIDKHPIGIDIERVRKFDHKLINYISNDEEKNYINDDKSFFIIWTNKEALVKANGVGIKQKPISINALPINDIRTYQGNKYYNKTIEYLDTIITVSRNHQGDYSLNIIKEDIN